MNREEQQALALARWLDAVERGEGGVEPPTDVDPDVLAAIWALRPDLAPPAPRFTVDDLLADVREGPFTAAPAPEGTAVVPFPVPAARPPAPAPARRRWQPVLIGLAALAAAMLLVVGGGREGLLSSPGASREVAAVAEPPGGGAAVPEPAAADNAVVAADEPADRTVREDVGTGSAEGLGDLGVRSFGRGGDLRRRVPADDTRYDVAAARPPAVAAPEAEPVAAAKAAREVDDAVVVAEVEDAVVVADEVAPAAAAPTAEPFGYGLDAAPTRGEADVAGAPAASVTLLRGVTAPPPAARKAEAAPEALEAARPASDPVAEVRAAVDRAARLARRDPLAAAREVAPLVVPPADAGLIAAEAAARWALLGGDPASAAAWARRGLALDGGPPDARARVEALLREAEAALAR